MGETEQHRLIRERLARNHPGLAKTHFRATSPQDKGYNCLAFAAHNTREWWHPCAFGGCYWPTGEQPDSLETWIAGFAHLGFEICDSREHEVGIEKIAIFADAYGPTHIARQLRTGFWTSKMGKVEDIEHVLEGLEGGKYGRVAILMRRLIEPQHTFQLLDHPDDQSSG